MVDTPQLRALAALAALWFSLGGCRDEYSGDETRPSSVRPFVEPYAALVADATTRRCACEYVETGYPSPSSCLVQELEPRSTLECQVAVLDAEHDTALPFLDCAMAAETTYVACLESSGCTGTVRVGCLEDRRAALSVCPPLTADVATRLSACSRARGFPEGSGDGSAPEGSSEGSLSEGSGFEGSAGDRGAGDDGTEGADPR